MYIYICTHKNYFYKIHTHNAHTHTNTYLHSYILTIYIITNSHGVFGLPQNTNVLYQQCYHFCQLVYYQYIPPLPPVSCYQSLLQALLSPSNISLVLPLPTCYELKLQTFIIQFFKYLLEISHSHTSPLSNFTNPRFSIFQFTYAPLSCVQCCWIALINSSSRSVSQAIYQLSLF